MGGNERATAPNVERRAVLTTRRPEIISSLATAGIDPNSDEGRSAQVWAAAILKARDAWADSNRHGRRYSDREANGPLIRRAQSSERN
jgi:hypothetical protein